MSEPPGHGDAVPPVTAPRYGRRVLVGAAACGFVLAIALGLLLGAVGWWPGTGSSGGIGGWSAASVSLPARLGDYQRFADLRGSDPRGAGSAANTATQDAASAAGLAAAYHGAGAAVQTYGDQNLETIFVVNVVRADSPDLYVRTVDADYLGLAVPPRRVEQFGAVACAVGYDPVPKDQPVPSDAAHTEQCQRSGAGLTVNVAQVTGDLGSRPSQVATLVDQVWSALH
jgi:hypothetical protein